MKAFLLAAGRGTRISKHIPDIPKSALDVGGKPLILRTVEMLLSYGVEVNVIIGYKADRIREILHKYPVNIIYNPFFDVTNSIGSLWMAKDYLKDEETIIANADVFWPQDLFEFIKKQNKDVFMLSDQSRVKEGDYFFHTENNIIKKYGKELSVAERSCEYVGIAYMSASFAPLFKERLLEKINHQEHGCWWEDVLYDLIDVRDIYAVDIESRFWAEIDSIDDYKRIVNFVNANL